MTPVDVKGSQQLRVIGVVALRNKAKREGRDRMTVAIKHYPFGDGDESDSI